MEFVETLKDGDIVKHFKGNYYTINGFAIDSENANDKTKRMVIYTPLYFREGLDYSDITTEDKQPAYTRPLQMFTENVDRPEFKYSGPRFQTVKLRSEESKDIVKIFAFSLVRGKIEEKVASSLLDNLIESIQDINSVVDKELPVENMLKTLFNI